MKLDDLYEYSKAVSYYADNKKNNVLSNEGKEHAVIVFENIFRTAEKKVSIYAKNIFSPDNEVTCSAPYVEEIRKFLSKPNTSMQILLQEYDEELSYNVLRDELKKYPDKVSFKINDVKKVREGESYVHFCIADGRMYRMEYNTGNRKARCNFNDPEAVAKYQEVFTRLFNDVTTKASSL